MDSEKNSDVALLSIQPEYIRSIVTGKKKVEFRRHKFAKPVEHIVIYGTRPIQKIVAYFRVSHITLASPHELWGKYQQVAGIGKRVFQEYFKGANEAVAIGIESVMILSNPVALHKISKELTPPQSFTYLSEALFKKVCKFL